MSEYAEPHRRAMKAKAHRLANGDSVRDEHEKVDATTVHRPEAFEGGKKNMPIRPRDRAYKRGGKVEGEHAKHHAGKAPRKSVGGMLAARVGNPRPDGIPMPGEMTQHPGLGRVARKSGGRTHKADGGSFVPTSRLPSEGASSEMARAAGLKRGGRAHGDEAEDRALVKKMVKPSARTGKAMGGLEDHERYGDRVARREGGRAGRGKTNINIVIAQPRNHDDQPGMGPGPMAPKPAGMPIPMPAQGAMPGMPPGAPAPAAIPVPVGGGGGGMGGAGPGFSGGMPRKKGGRVQEYGAATGMERAERAGHPVRK